MPEPRCDDCQYASYDETYNADTGDERCWCNCEHPDYNSEAADFDPSVFAFWLGQRDESGSRCPAWCPLRPKEAGDGAVSPR